MDTVRAGVVVEDAGMMAAVLEAIGAHVGRLLRSKNAFCEDAEVSYGYRAFLGNLQLESGLTVGEVFGGAQRAKWEALADAGEAADAAEGAPGGWEEYVDDASGAPYWHCALARRTTWPRPAPSAPRPPRAAPAKQGTSSLWKVRKNTLSVKSLDSESMESLQK